MNQKLHTTADYGPQVPTAGDLKQQPRHQHNVSVQNEGEGQYRADGNGGFSFPILRVLNITRLSQVLVTGA